MTGPPVGVAVRAGGLTCAVVLAGVMLGCKASPSELRGKTSFGPEFRNRGNNTSEVRYDARQALELKWDNGCTTGIQYRRRDVDDGSGDNENRVLVEVGYPLWKAKKPDKTAQRIDRLERQVEEVRARIAESKGATPGSAEVQVAQGESGADLEPGN